MMGIRNIFILERCFTLSKIITKQIKVFFIMVGTRFSVQEQLCSIVCQAVGIGGDDVVVKSSFSGSDIFVSKERVRRR